MVKNLSLNPTIEEIKIYSAYGEKLKPTIKFTGKGRTKQQFLKDCDINRIVASANRTGVIDHLSKHVGTYGAITPVDFQESLNIVIQAQESFDALPSKIRNQFENDPKQFLMFTSDPSNEEEMINMGLLNPKPKETPLTASGEAGGNVSSPPATPDDQPSG